MPPNYSNTKIYMIYCNNPNISDIYIGYTTMDIKERMKVHDRCTRNPANKSYTNRQFTFIRENGGWSNWSYRIIDEQICCSKKEARELEKYWMRHYNPSLNTNK